MRSGAALPFTLLALCFVPKLARADETGFMIAPSVLLVQPRLSSANFSGSGVVYGDSTNTTYSHSGREIGIHAPVMIGAELRLGIQHRYFEIGGQLVAAASLGDSNSATDPEAAQLARASSLGMFGGGVHAMITIPAGVVTFAIGPDFGVRGFQLPLTGFEPTVCHNRYGTYSCPETATYTQPYFQPRVTMIVHGDPKAPASFFFGPWLGVDVIPAPSWAGGFTFGWGANQNRMR